MGCLFSSPSSLSTEENYLVPEPEDTKKAEPSEPTISSIPTPLLSGINFAAIDDTDIQSSSSIDDEEINQLLEEEESSK